MKPTSKFAIAGGIIAIVIVLSLTSQLENQPTYTGKNSADTLRIGYRPNINDAPDVIGIGNGDFQKKLGDTKIEPQIFNAGPSQMEALFANQIDVAFVGPGPAINAYVKSHGDLRIISGVSSGGASFVIRNDSGIGSTQDFAGKKFSSPQLGNTQDISLRTYLLNNGYKTTENGGSVTVQPAANPEIVTLMLKKDIDGAWVPEPWVTTLVHQANGKIFLDERNLWPNGKFATVIIVARSGFLKDNPDIIKKLLEANVDEINWINSNPDQARQAFNMEFEKLTQKIIPDDRLKEALSRTDITYDPVKNSLYKSADDAYNLGFLGDKKPDLSNIFDLKLLNEVLEEKNLDRIP